MRVLDKGKWGLASNVGLPLAERESAIAIAQQFGLVIFGGNHLAISIVPETV